ncbi:MAG: amino acid permease [Candidatus Rokuibacteriota bacterium]|nr:MAG: amino acid permease [Candidatus Rokubacteria bacterium]PYM64226.1 MAG: amino acid permease [Candidatus Rokubacteria bacterium]PYN67080.1 MAG: amino acid permease [Candidatus Rokubacteria bacterium]
MHRLKRLFVGTPLPTAQQRHERLGKATALAVFASDPLSSVAYATEEILFVLVLAGSAALSYSLPIGIGIAALILIVISSYRQTIRAYPQGGGAYIVAKDNLGVFPSLVAAAALLIDYVLTVAVSVAAGVAAVTSAVPELFPYRTWLCVVAVVGVAVTNLRGVRESGQIFAAPTYLFVVSVLGMVAWGVGGAALGMLPAKPYEPHAPGLEGIGLFLFLRAFSAGCTALTGVEAVSDGVPAFKPPEAHNARIVMAWLGAISVTMFLGITYLAYDLGIVPGGNETVVSKIARQLFGTGPLYFELQAVTMLILLLAANTSFADFPRLSFFLARDRFIPRQFGTQGDRLVFSNGIVILAGLASVLLVVFQGDTHALLPLYAIGVFVSFTVSQSSMVRRWLRLRETGWWWRVWLNGIGAFVTGVVLLTLAVTKFTEGAWIVVLLIPTLVAAFLTVRRHYEEVAAQLSLEGFEPPPPMTNTVLVLVGDIHRGVIKAIQYAQSLSPTAKAVFVEIDPERTRKLEEKWGKWGMGVPLIVLSSPYRSLLGPLLEYIDHLQKDDENHVVTIVLPEFIPARWWQLGLHNQTALLIKGAMLFRKNVTVTDVPYHLKH